MKKIVIDIRMYNSSGIGTYLQNILPFIISSLPNYTFVLLGNESDLNNVNFNINNITKIKCNSKIYSINEQIELISKIPKDTDLFWSPHYNVPIMYKGNLLVTVHDLFHLAMPQFVEGLHKKLYAKLMFAILSRKAKKIICVSKFTFNEYKKYIKGGQDKLICINNGVNKSWFNIVSKDNLKCSKPYFIYVGNVKPHKNLSNLIEGFKLVKDKIPHNLVIVGKKEGFITTDKKVFNEAQVLSNRIQFTGYLEKDLLEQYIKNASALIFPSLYEGFGLPPLESMACGCPAIVSNSASIPEVCGNAALYFNPNSPIDISKKLIQFNNDRSLRESLIIRGKKQATLYKWEDSAKKTLSIIKEILNENSNSN
ncbi:glycosyltransferase family 4 protein [Terrilactibacillus laevilacticus]|uniref:glycosyltransferase family 4 protein n=1 Tax=Terrilactibacillus laevilacticus TaxID=1380157 RepID=UPI0011468C23|nr:glycosyltransferase family 1 protein [Terrilactibacillus laevilacticus]